ncbi:MAG: lipopolysaccharide heptosyltransferase II, partial [Acidobacteria bacterium]|nr:lipopolysaccharide heptosyltransferase II [Acidobacteriota bacterium]
ARPSVAPLFALVDGVESVVTLPSRSGVGSLRAWKSEAAALVSGAYDIAVLLPNSFAAAWLAARAGIGDRWGFAGDMRARLLTKAIPKPKGLVHQGAYYQALTSGLGITSGPLHAQVRVPPRPDALLPRSAYIVLAPGAAYGKAKQWPVEHFAALATQLIDAGQAVVLVGSRADHSTCAAIVAQTRDASAVSNLAGRTSLAELTAVLGHADAVVSNDSGAMHLAGATGVPVVALFGATNEHRTAPLGNGPTATPPAVLTAAAWCRPCMLRECPIDHHCMTGITPERAAVATLEAAGKRGQRS